MPNYFIELLLAILRIATLGVVFYLLHPPVGRFRSIAAIGVIILQYPICRILFFASNRNFVASVAADTIIFLILGYLCRGESKDNDDFGDLTRPIVSAIYLNVILQFLNYTLGAYAYAVIGTLPPSFSLEMYAFKVIEALILLLWTLFYYRIARNMAVNTPLSFTLFTIFTPIAGLVAIAASSRLNADSSSVMLFGGVFGTLILALNMSVFYLYVKLSVAYESLRFAQSLARTPPVWTAEAGLSAAFISKYEITPREREVVEILLSGKTDKEIAIALDIAVNTVQVHLKRIYRKTGAAGRFALSALVRGE
jgi:DNA-binding CsgD family transcriptional regulator